MHYNFFYKMNCVIIDNIKKQEVKILSTLAFGHVQYYILHMFYDLKTLRIVLNHNKEQKDVKKLFHNMSNIKKRK